MPSSRKCAPRFAASFLKPTRELNFKYLAEGKGATVTARFGPDGITICDPNRASEGATRCFRGFTRSQFELLSGAVSHYQELTPLWFGLLAESFEILEKPIIRTCGRPTSFRLGCHPPGLQP